MRQKQGSVDPSAIGGSRRSRWASLPGGFDHLGGKQRDQQEVGGVEVRRRHLLGGDTRRDRVCPLPAVALVDRDSREPERGHVGERAGIELAATVILGVARGETALGELTHRLLEVALLIAEAEVHQPTPLPGSMAHPF